jgi:hypothetical protein
MPTNLKSTEKCSATAFFAASSFASSTFVLALAGDAVLVDML